MSTPPAPPTFLTQHQAQELDARLMGEEGGYSVDQLMELAGLACAVAVQKEHPDVQTPMRILCGPGNNGGDGLVCARHLIQFGYREVSIVYPSAKPPADLFRRLLQQATLHGVVVYGADLFEANRKHELAGLFANNAVAVDALFGFSFRPPLREPYQTLLEAVVSSRAKVVSIDVPTGWHVEEGPGGGGGVVLHPDVLVSLTAPKLCARHLKEGAIHYVGGRFVPPGFAPLLQLPVYPKGPDMVMKLANL